MARTLYDVLCVSPHADRDIILVVYRHLAKRYHPDRDPSPEAVKRMTEVNKAWATLGDATKRARYDESIGLRRKQPKAVTPRGDGRPMRAGGVSSAPRTGPYGEAGPPPPNPPAHGRPLTFGRYRGWTLNQVLRHDHDYVEWLARTTMGRNFKTELDQLLRRVP